jgi:hypothetical protein
LLTDLLTKFGCAVAPWVDILSPSSLIQKVFDNTPEISGSYAEFFSRGKKHIEFVEATSDPENPFKDASDYPVNEKELADRIGCPARITHVTVGIYKGNVRVEFHEAAGSLTNRDKNQPSQENPIGQKRLI